MVWPNYPLCKEPKALLYDGIRIFHFLYAIYMSQKKIRFQEPTEPSAQWTESSEIMMLAREAGSLCTWSSDIFVEWKVEVNSATARENHDKRNAMIQKLET